MQRLEKVLVQLYFQTHLLSLVSQFIGNDLVRLSTVVFTYLGMMDALLFLFMCKSCLRREILCPDEGGDYIQKGNTSITHRTLEPSLLHKHCIHIFTLMSCFYLQVKTPFLCCVTQLLEMYCLFNSKSDLSKHSCTVSIKI